MPKDNLDTLPPRFTFTLNPYKDFRLSRCPLCRKLTHMRKFALLIHIEGWGFLALGKTCRFCSPCELIIAHKDELEDELVHAFERINPEAIGQPYHVYGTVEKSRWKKSLGREPDELAESLKYVSPFKDQINLTIRGGWAPMEKPNRRKL